MRRLLGIIFCCIAAILYVVNYLAAVMYTISRPEREVGLGFIRTAYRIVGRTPEHLACIALVIGIVYLVIGELNQIKSKKKS
jgi:hypothetical protein